MLNRWQFRCRIQSHRKVDWRTCCHQTRTIDHQPLGYPNLTAYQIDLEGSDDDIREIQQEISLLSTCSSDHVTRYKASFVRGVKLWIVMEYLGGGSCLDLV